MPRGTAAQRRQVTELHGKGLGRNTIAREVDCSVGTVTNIAQDLGLSFDRAMTKASTAARKADCAERRSRLEQQLLADAEQLRGQVFTAHEYIDHGGKDYIEVRWLQDEPSPADKLKLMQAAGIAVDRSLRIGELDKDDEVEEAKAMLVDLFEKLGVAFRTGPVEA